MKLGKRKILTKVGKGWLKFMLARIIHFVEHVGLIALLLFGGYKYIENKLIKEEAKTSIVLKEGERRKAIIDFRKNTLTTVEKNGEEQTVRLKPGLRKAVITESTEGEIDVWAPTWGFVFEPGYGAFYSDKTFYGGLDIQWFYWRRLGLSGGLGISGRNDVIYTSFYPLAVNYNLPFYLTPNTNVFIGISAERNIVLGASVKW